MGDQRMERCSCCKFYRGMRCPYGQSRTACLPDPAARDSKLGGFIGRGISREAEFVPAIPFEFPMRHDFGNAVARQFGLELTIDGAFQSSLRDEFGTDLPVRNGNELDTTSSRSLRHFMREED